jgi:hypothetical protein
VVEPEQTCAVPVIGVAIGLTVTTTLIAQPVGSVKKIAVIPAEFPVIIPEADPIDAMAGLEDDHTPPDDSVSVVV